MFHPRARTMLLLSLPALIIGVASSLVFNRCDESRVGFSAISLATTAHQHRHRL